MLAGGTDRTSVGLEWLMAELMRNPRVMKKVQKEIGRVVGKKPQIDMNDIGRMDYLKCVIKENFRLHLPGPLLVQREISDNISIGGYDVPAKTRLFINAWAILRDPSTWERPEEFFSKRLENNRVDFKGYDFELIPFGVGRRGFPGLAFGVASIEYITANVLYWFDWKLPVMVNYMGTWIRVKIMGALVHKKVPLYLVPAIHSCL
ncbi:hypothetical protein TIFTF001_026029 [Ficus carica]|uniref:Cytochrome P450 n=1 Tax=Ficus carica TaxID=3494 RepID=A0AA88APW8_FICCA|nr:hypothetical protein TIFTF001_026029 [Ficus carica]